MMATQLAVEVASTMVVCHGRVEDVELRSHSESVIPTLVKTHGWKYSRIDDRLLLCIHAGDDAWAKALHNMTKG